MTNIIIAKANIDNYAFISGFISKRGIKKENINLNTKRIDKTTFTLITHDISDKIVKFFNITKDDLLLLKNDNGEKYICIKVEALDNNAKFCQNLKANDRVQLLGEFKIRKQNGKTILSFLLSSKPIAID